ncbi:MAG TPA: sigma-54 dependent transcriptional regulator [Candidatus Brocadiaceae bacterium]|nr:sigma-54 dependent transcriptional regulator [Candidatus Brocadiaceae bacterium]
MRTVLIIDKETEMHESFRVIFGASYRVLAAVSGDVAMEILQHESIDVVMLDMATTGLDVLKDIRNAYTNVNTIIITTIKNINEASEAIKMGADDYIIKPLVVEDIQPTVDRLFSSKEMRREMVNIRSESELELNIEFNNIIGQCPAMQDVFSTIIRAAGGNLPILITGESGTGKELVARAIHAKSQRNTHPFIVVSCPNLSDTLLESELFGHEKGSFTNATDKKIGRFEQAHSGTIFLDEISEMGLPNQAKLLRVLQEYEFLRVGGVKTVNVDVRIIAATNINLKTAIVKGAFRADLFYRIHVVPIHLPPLRNRREDLPHLVNYFILKYQKECHSTMKKIHPDAMESLGKYHWPGNIRELKNVIERILTLYGDQKTMLYEHLPEEIRRSNNHVTPLQSLNVMKLLETSSMDETVSSIEKEIIENALQKAGGVYAKAAQFLKTTKRRLRYKINKLGIR